MEIAQRHKAVLLVNFGLKVSIVLKEGHVHTHVYVCVYVCTCVCVRDSSISRQPHLSIFIKAGSGHPFLLSYTEAERKTVQ